MKENLSEERAVDTVGRPTSKSSSMGSSKGSSKSEMTSGSAKGVGGGLQADVMKDEPIFHEPAYRTKGKDNNYESKVQSGLPRQEASYQNRDRNGSGLENEPKYQRKLASYPKGNRGMSDKTKTLN